MMYRKFLCLVALSVFLAAATGAAEEAAPVSAADEEAVPAAGIFAGLFDRTPETLLDAEYREKAAGHVAARLQEECPGADPAWMELLARLDYNCLPPSVSLFPDDRVREALPEECVRSLLQWWVDETHKFQSVMQIRDALEEDDTPSWSRICAFSALCGMEPKSAEFSQGIREELIRFAASGRMKGDDVWYLYSRIGSFLDGSEEWQEFIDGLKLGGEPDPWLLTLAEARAAQERAWKARGEDYAYKVSRENMRVYWREMEKARDLFHRALELHPERGNPYLRLIDVEKCLSNVPGSVEAFKMAVRHCPDNSTVYEGAMWAFLPRWGGSISLLTAAGDACLESGLLDTMIPVYGFDFYGHAAWDQRGCQWKAVYLRDEVIAAGDRLYQARMEATEPGWKPGYDYCMFSRMMFEAATLRYDKAAATMEEFGGEARAREYFEKDYTWEWCKLSRFYPRMPRLQDVVTEVKVGNGPHGEAFRAAEQEFLTGQAHRGVAMLGELVREPALTPEEKEFLLDQLGRWSMPCSPEAYIGPNNRIYSALQVADKEGFPHVTAILTQLGADPAAHEKYPGEAAIAAASDGRDPNVLDRLRAQGDPLTRPEPEHGRSPLHLALLCDNIRMTAKLIELEVPLETRDRAGHVPLHLAAVGDAPLSATLLLEAGVDADIQDGDGETALMFTLQVCASKEMRRLLIKYSEDIDRANRSGRTALHFAVQYEKDPQAVRDLVAAGADPERADASGVTPRALAGRMGKKAFVEAMQK